MLGMKITLTLSNFIKFTGKFDNQNSYKSYRLNDQD